MAVSASSAATFVRENLSASPSFFVFRLVLSGCGPQGGKRVSATMVNLHSIIRRFH
jgi:hypothetical protein